MLYLRLVPPGQSVRVAGMQIKLSEESLLPLLIIKRVECSVTRVTSLVGSIVLTGEYPERRFLRFLPRPSGCRLAASASAAIGKPVQSVDYLGLLFYAGNVLPVPS